MWSPCGFDATGGLGLGVAANLSNLEVVSSPISGGVRLLWHQALSAEAPTPGRSRCCLPETHVSGTPEVSQQKLPGLLQPILPAHEVDSTEHDSSLGLWVWVFGHAVASAFATTTSASTLLLPRTPVT